MAKLPTREDLGRGGPEISPNRGIARFDPTPIGEGVAAYGRGLERRAKQTGETFDRMADVGHKLNDILNKRNAHDAEVMVQEFEWNERMALEKLKREAGPDQLDGFAESWADGYMGRARDIFNQVPDYLRDKYDARLFQTERSLFTDAQDFASGQQRMIAGSDKDRMKGRVGTEAATARTMEELDQIVSKVRDNLENDTRLSAGEREVAIRELENEVANQFLGGLDWKTRRSVIAGIRASRGEKNHGLLEAFESGGNPAIVNTYGYAGKYQFGAPRLVSLGLYSPGDEEALGSWSKTSRHAPGKWSGEFKIPGHRKVKTLADFLASPEAQSVAFKIHMREIDQQMVKRGLTKYIGETVNGVEITRDGIRYMAHLGGIGGAQDFLKKGRNPSDAYGTSLSRYAQLGAQMGEGGGGHASFATLTEDDLDRWIKEDEKLEKLETAEGAAERAIGDDIEARTEAEAIQRVRDQGLDQDVQDNAVARVKQRYEELEQAKIAARKEQYDDVYAKVRDSMESRADVAATLALIPADMNAEDRTELNKMAKRGVAVEDNAQVYDDVLALRGAEPEVFRKLDLWKEYRGNLTADTIAKLQADQTEMGETPDTDSVYTVSAQVKNRMKEMGIETGEKAEAADLRFANHINRIMSDELKAAQKAKGTNKLDASEEAAVVNEVFKKFMSPAESWWPWAADQAVGFKTVFEGYEKQAEKEGMVPGSLVDLAYHELRSTMPDEIITAQLLREWLDRHVDRMQRAAQ